MEALTGDDWREILSRIPEEQISQFVLVLSSGTEVNIGDVVRIEAKYLVIRGRQGGNVDESRGFFVPFNSITYLRWERMVRIEELRALYPQPVNTALIATEAEIDLQPPPATELMAKPPLTPVPNISSDVTPGSAAARNILLDRIRAARASGK
jgi:hypothetical protein